VVIPFMPMFNNLVIFDHHVPQHSLETIRPELATAWKWTEEGTALTFALRPG
jgi:peptide/nickel transport system substrate-binding protein